MSRADDLVAERQHQLAAALAERRGEAELSQTELARRVSYDRTTVTHAERGAQVPAVEFWNACDELLGAEGALLGLYEAWREAKRRQAAEEAEQVRVERWARLGRTLPPPLSNAAITLDGVPEDEGGDRALASPRDASEAGEPTDRRDVLKVSLAAAVAAGTASRALWQAAAETAEFTRRAQASAVGSGMLDHLQHVVADVSDAYAHEPPAALFDITRRYRQQVARLIDGPKTLPEARELFTCAGWLSETLAWMTHDLGDTAAADAYCNDAWEHADQVGHSELCAWAMDAKASIGMYAGRPGRALAAALRGLGTVPARHPLAVRLHGQVARASARLAREGRGPVEACGDHLRQAEALYEALPAQSPALFGLNTEVLAAQAVHSYAASSHLWLGEFSRAKTSAERALDVHLSASPQDRSPSREAIARIDLGTALAALGEPDEACALGRQALACGRIVDSVLIRASDLAAAVTQRYPALPEARELVGQVEALRPGQP